MLVVYVGPSLDGVEIDGLEVVAEPGVPVDVPDDVAGRVPHGHRADEDYDPGEGLLAQSSNWQPAPTVKVSKPAKSDPAPAAVEGESV